MMAIEAEGLRKSFGKVQALRGVDLGGAAGQRLRPAWPERRGQDHRGPRARHAHQARWRHRPGAGHDVVREPGKVRAAIGLAGQHAAVDDDLTGRENLLHPRPDAAPGQAAGEGAGGGTT